MARQIREPRNPVNARQAYAALVESERNRQGVIQQVGTIFLTNRECPFQCSMCDLWKNTLVESVKVGDIPYQITTALNSLPKFDSIKLYNSGNFFDTSAIPRADYPDISRLVRTYSDCIVENHPKLVSHHCREFMDLVLPAQLEVALGLETCHEPSLQVLNKSMSLADFESATELLLQWGIRIRVFLMLGLPNMSMTESVDWTLRSIEYAAGCGADCFSIIPTRPTMPLFESLLKNDRLQMPTASSIETVLDAGIQLGVGRVFIDLWDAERFFGCSNCAADRLARLNLMNLQQQQLPKVHCPVCSEV